MTCSELTSRMSDRARHVMALAEQKADHDASSSVRPEDVLFGLIEEGHGIAANVLLNLDVDLDSLRQATGGCGLTDEWRTASVEWSVETQECIERANEESKSLNLNYLGTEHLLLGVALSGGDSVAKRLREWGVTLEAIREEVWAMLGHEL